VFYFVKFVKISDSEKLIHVENIKRRIRKLLYNRKALSSAGHKAII